MSVFSKISLILLLLLSAACAGPGNFSKTYRQMVEPVGDEDAYLLDKGARPRLIISENFESDFQTFKDQNYIMLGRSRFNGPPEKLQDAVDLGEELGVTHVLIGIEYLYEAEKKAFKTYENYDYVRDYVNIDGLYYPTYQAVANPIVVPYMKKFGVYQHEAVYLVKLKESDN